MIRLFFTIPIVFRFFSGNWWFEQRFVFLIEVILIKVDVEILIFWMKLNGFLKKFDDLIKIPGCLGKTQCFEWFSMFRVEINVLSEMRWYGMKINVFWVLDILSQIDAFIDIRCFAWDSMFWVKFECF